MEEEDDELILEEMKEFLEEDESEKEEEGIKYSREVREEQDEFTAAAQAVNEKSWTLGSAEEEAWAEDAVSLAGRRRLIEEEVPSEKAVEQVRIELEQLETNAHSDSQLPSDALQFLSSESGRDLDDGTSVAASGFLRQKSIITNSSNSLSKASAYGLYEPTAISTTPPKRSLENEIKKQQQQEEEGVAMSYKEFLARLMLPQSAELVSHVRAFVVRVLEEAREREDAVRARKPGAIKARKLALEALPNRCAKFFDAAEAHMEEHPSWRHLGHVGLASARAALEKYVLSKMGNWAFEASRDDFKDMTLTARCRALATFVKPTHLDIKPGLCDNEVVLRIACDELKRIDALNAPADKVECVVRCASIIFSALNLSRAKPAEEIDDDHYSDNEFSHADPRIETSVSFDDPGTREKPIKKKKKSRVVSESRAGADDFLPVFIYVVLHADAPRLYSNCDFVQAFHNPAALMSKSGYCFVNLRSAVEFLLHLTHDQLGMEKNDFHAKLLAGLQATGGDPSLAESVKEDDRENHPAGQ